MKVDISAYDDISSFILIAAAIVLLARLAVFNSRRTDRRLNAALAFAFLCVAFRHPLLANEFDCLVAPSAQDRLHLVSETAIIGFATVLVIVGYEWVFRHGRGYVVPAIYAAAVLLTSFEIAVELRAASHNEVPNLVAGWAVVAYSSPAYTATAALVLQDVFGYAFAIAIFALAIREYRRRSRQTLLVCLGIAVIALCSALDTTVRSVAMAYGISGAHANWIDELAQDVPLAPCVELAVFTALVAIPVGKAALHRLRVDRSSRLRRRLTPLWADLTAAFPETVLSTSVIVAGRHSHFQLHRTVVEIRDCMLLLSAAHREGLALRRAQPAHELQTALQLATESAGSLGQSRRLELASGNQAADLVHDAQELCRLVEHWPAAKLRAERLVDCHAVG